MVCQLMQSDASSVIAEGNVLKGPQGQEKSTCGEKAISYHIFQSDGTSLPDIWGLLAPSISTEVASRIATKTKSMLEGVNAITLCGVDARFPSQGLEVGNVMKIYQLFMYFNIFAEKSRMS